MWKHVGALLLLHAACVCAAIPRAGVRVERDDDDFHIFVASFD